jgi:hypothetical protein
MIPFGTLNDNAKIFNLPVEKVTKVFKKWDKGHISFSF